MPYLPLVLTMVGWWVVSRQHDKRERRKEVRELIGNVEQRIGEVLDLALEYYALDGSSAKCIGLASKINTKISSVSQLLARLKKAGFDHQSTKQFIAFKQALTGVEAEFESAERKKQGSNGQVLNRSTSAGLSLLSLIEGTYFAAFPVRIRRMRKFWAK